ncbi:hypothetical protein ACVWYF_001130 [Hymenobacter sp. UYAg731]
MYPIRVLSYANGWQQLVEQKPSEWNDIQHAISMMDANSLRIADTPGQQDARRNGEMFHERIRVRNFQYYWDNISHEMGWGPLRHRSNNGAGLRLTIRNAKNRVSTRMGIALDRLSLSQFTSWLFVEVPRAHVTDLCDVSVLLVPTEDVKEIIDDIDRRTSTSLFTEERCRAQIEDLYPLRNSSPFVIIFFSLFPSDREIEVDEIPLYDVPDDSEDVIEKCIEFAPEYYQAGVGILSYFGEILRQKHPEMNAKVRIEQEGRTVRLHIESPSGDKEIIEETLNDFVLVVADQAPPESLLEDKLQIMALENKLEIARMEARQGHQLLAITQSSYDARITLLEGETVFLRRHLGEQLLQISTGANIISKQIDSAERVLLAQMEQSSIVFSSLITAAQGNESVLFALKQIENILKTGLNNDSEKEVRSAVSVIQSENPKLLPLLAEAANNVSYGVAGSAVFELIKSFMHIS